jgi:hypothetical protein
LNRKLLFLITSAILAISAACSLPFRIQWSGDFIATVVEETMQALPAKYFPSATQVPSLFSGLPLPTSTQPPPTNIPDPCYQAHLISETVLDGTTFTAGEPFTKTWRLLNTGSCTWNPNYRLVFSNIDQMEGPDFILLDTSVAPGGQVEILVNLKAPIIAGTHIGYWRLQADNGIRFARISVKIHVDESSKAIPTATSSATSVFIDDFEKYRSDKMLQKAYQVWQDGAFITTALEETNTNSGSKAIRVEAVSPNPQTNTKNGSIFRALPFSFRDWSTATGVRFWVKNTSKEPLLLSFNFKESFNEYWAIANSGIFFLESEPNNILKRDIEYGNLIIPGQYAGHVMVPFSSFSVPSWDTARGDKVMNLSQIESFAFGITIEKEWPIIFYLDDIEAIARSDYKYLKIEGLDTIQIPASGELHEQFKAYQVDPQTNASQIVEADWKLLGENNNGVAVDIQGWLIIPSKLPESSVHLMAIYSTPKGNMLAEHNVDLVSSGITSVSSSEANQEKVVATFPINETAYDRFSRSFEKWASEKRPLFVVISVGAILFFLLLLSNFQKKIK